MTGSIVIVGAGLAGLKTAEELRKAGHTGRLVLLGDEGRLPYDRPPLSKKFLLGELDDTTLKPAEFFVEKDIELRLESPAIGVDTANRRLRLADGEELEYDELIIATGLRPRRIPGLPEGVHVLRQHGHATELRGQVEALLAKENGSAATALVVGAGFIGCEVASTLRARGLSVVLVEPQVTPLAAALGPEVGAMVADLHREQGVDVRSGVGLESLVVKDDSADGTESRWVATLSDGSQLAADLVVVGVGSAPVTEWLAESGVPLADPAKGGGVLADAAGRTEVPGVWAVGDVAAWARPDAHPRRFEHWSSAGEQARLLAAALLGTAAPAPGVPYVWSDQYDLKIQVLGDPSAADEVQVVDAGRKFLVHYLAAGELVAVAGAGRAGDVMKMRANLAG
ncbi:NAD(P)/FAD-dependent oxidoreductase [Nocardia stercoris]|uniref:FAD-dependent oxidoreductase n=1 Tax=Nocardia stercoris TaxID=2483361 RepID=A0A3M2L2L7_9NOCA|nr:FAD-dependent oxidoreductase [Nocardia stercoris]RMI30970.1 FAD-dependent oxidoreductase [Nocardia stercoris]